MVVSEKHQEKLRTKIDSLKIARSKPRPKKRYKRTILTKENEVLLAIARSAKLKLVNYRDDREFHSLTNAIEDAIDRVHKLEELLMVFKEIFDLAVERDDVKYLIYGFNKKLNLDQQIIFKKILKRKRDGEK